MPKLIVIEQAYYAQDDSQPVVHDSRFVRMLMSNDLPFIKVYKLDGAWVDVDYGWLEGASVLIVECHTRRWERQPTDEERAEEGARRLELSCGGTTFAVVRPGESARFEPASRARIRAVGEATATITAVPM